MWDKFACWFIRTLIITILIYAILCKWYKKIWIRLKTHNILTVSIVETEKKKIFVLFWYMHTINNAQKGWWRTYNFCYLFCLYFIETISIIILIIIIIWWMNEWFFVLFSFIIFYDIKHEKNIREKKYWNFAIKIILVFIGLRFINVFISIVSIIMLAL